MKKSIKKKRNPEFLRFTLTGGSAAAFNIALRYVLTPFVGYSSSIIIAYICAMTLAWILARLFVFPSTASHPLHEYTKFAIVNVVALLQVWGISMGLNDYFFPWVHFTYHPETVAHVISVPVPIFSSYFGHKYFTFRTKRYPNTDDM